MITNEQLIILTFIYYIYIVICSQKENMHCIKFYIVLYSV